MSAKAAATAARRSRDAPPADMLKDVAGSSQLRDLFLKYDDDNSGGIDADELEHIFVDVGEATTRRELDDLVRDFGAPCDDGEAGEFSVDFDGFCKMMVFLQRRGRLGGLFDFDACAGLSSVLAEGEQALTQIAREQTALTRIITERTERRIASMSADEAPRGDDGGDAGGAPRRAPRRPGTKARRSRSLADRPTSRAAPAVSAKKKSLLEALDDEEQSAFHERIEAIRPPLSPSAARTRRG
jgi:hypothetical protein